MKKPRVFYTTRENMNADINRLIEGSNEVERIAARMLKMMVPIITEVLESGDLSKLAGYVQGVSQLCASLLISVPDFMRPALSKIFKEQIEKAIEAAAKGPPEHMKRP